MADCGTLNVRPEFDPENVQVVDCMGLPSEVGQNGTVSMDVVVENANPSEASAQVVVMAGGQEVQTTSSFTISPDAELIQGVEFSPPGSGPEYEIVAEVQNAQQSPGPGAEAVSRGRTRTKNTH